MVHGSINRPTLTENQVSPLTLKRLGLSPNERGCPPPPPFISACREVRRQIFSESKYFVIRWTFCKKKSNQFVFNCLNSGRNVCWPWFQIFFLYWHPWLIYKLFYPWFFFIWGLIQCANLTIWSNLDVFSLFFATQEFQVASRRSGWIFFDFFFAKKSSLLNFRKSQDFSG